MYERVPRSACSAAAPGGQHHLIAFNKFPKCSKRNLQGSSPENMHTVDKQTLCMLSYFGLIVTMGMSK